MLRKIYQELVAIRKELKALRKCLIREPYDRNYNSVKAREGHKPPNEWWRFEDITENEAERSRMERVIEERCLSRQDLAIILFGLRVRPGFGKKDFGI